MPEYRYKAIDDNGKPHKGTMAADSETHLEEILNKGGYYLLEATAKHSLRRSAPKVETATGGQYGPPPDGVHLHQHLHQDFSIDFNAPLIMGFIGLLLVIGGCFAPFVHVPILGSYSMFLDGRGDGVGVAILSGIAMWLLFIRRYKILLIPTGIAAAVVLANVIYFMYLKSYKPPEQQGPRPMFDNPLEASAYEFGEKIGNNLARAFIQSVHLDWGLGLFVVGFILVFIAAAMGIKSSQVGAYG